MAASQQNPDEPLAPTSDDSAHDPELESLLQKVARVSEPAPLRLPASGAIIGEKYRVEAMIGRGGMGAVFRAVHVVSEKPVALKWMLRSASDENMRGRFLREARAAGRIRHPNVVDVYDCGQDADGFYLVMELLRGQTLRARLEQSVVAVAEAVDLLLPAMRGVMAAHQAGVVHRDIKPENIFLCEGHDGQPGNAMVLDFGVSALHEVDVEHPTLTADGVVLGTPAYTSPEQLQNARDIDARSDVYSFGVILYEMLTGSLPFAAESYARLLLLIINQPPSAPRQLRADLPAGLEQVVLRALAKRREDRFADMGELIAALAPFGSVGSASQATTTIQRPARRRRLWLLAAVVLIVLGVLAAQLARWSRVNGPPASKAETLTPHPVEVIEPEARAPSAEQPAADLTPPIAPAAPATVAAPADAPPPSAAAPDPAVAAPLRAAAPHGKRAAANRKHTAAAPAGETPRPPSCDPPYSIDAAGRRIFKVECL